MREIKILQQLDHENIVNMIEIIMAPPPDKDVFIVFDYLEHDLSGLLRSEIGKNLIKIGDRSGTEMVIKGIMFQLLRGLNYLHETGKIIHRDMKGSNILIDKLGRVKLADFGLARSMKGSKYDGEIVNATTSIPPIMTNRVITLWFRPPEVLLGSDTYGPEVDTWGLGCIFAELFLGTSAFKGSDEISQIEAILIGLANEQENSEEPLNIFSSLPWYKLIPKSLKIGFLKQSQQSVNENSLRNRLKNCTPKISQADIDLLFKLLKFNPLKRLSCKEALNIPYFEECGSKQFQENYRKCFETSECFKFELKSSSDIIINC